MLEGSLPFTFADRTIDQRRDVSWISAGNRCTKCGTLGSFVDWKIGYGPSDQLLNLEDDRTERNFRNWRIPAVDAAAETYRKAVLNPSVDGPPETPPDHVRVVAVALRLDIDLLRDLYRIVDLRARASEARERGHSGRVRERPRPPAGCSRGLVHGW